MGNIDSRPVCATHERYTTIRLLDSNIAHRTSEFEFFSKLLECSFLVLTGRLWAGAGLLLNKIGPIRGPYGSESRACVLSVAR
jgi:hypothetical protein